MKSVGAVKKLFKMIGIGVAVLIGMAALLAAIDVARNAYVPSSPVGIERALVQDAGRPPIEVTILYPTNAAPSWRWAGLWAAKLASGGAIAGTKRPLVVLSHGTGATPLSHLDSALALVEAGYIVAAPLHTGDNYRDDTLVGTPNWFVSRASDIQRVDDFLLGRWAGRGHIDPDKLAFFGFSAGATTGLVAIGAQPDLATIEAHCTAHPEFVCTLRKPGGHDRTVPPNAWPHDPRIKAAVLVAPGLGFAFPASRLRTVRTPVQLWVGDQDQQVPPATNAETVKAALPAKPDYRRVPGAGHFSFLPPCGAVSVALPRALCHDRQGFDRAAFHQSFNTAVVAFFDRHFDRR